MPPSFLVYTWIYFILLFLICNKICKVWEASEPDDTEHCVYSGCVLHLLAAAVGRYLRVWVTSAGLLLPGPCAQAEAEMVSAVAGTHHILGPVLASIQTNLLWTSQSTCAPMWSWILLLNFEAEMSDFCWGTVGVFYHWMPCKIDSTLSLCR